MVTPDPRSRSAHEGQYIFIRGLFFYVLEFYLRVVTSPAPVHVYRLFFRGVHVRSALVVGVSYVGGAHVLRGQDDGQCGITLAVVPSACVVSCYCVRATW